MNQELDLRQLAVRRDGNAETLRRPRAWFTRLVLPGTILAGFLSLLAWSLRDQWQSARAVTVIPVVATRGEFQAEGASLFQAAGWVEPRPTPVLVSALGEGVVDQLLVVEGQEVKAGDVIARLNPGEAALAVKSAKADLGLRQAEVAAAAAAHKAALLNLEHPNLLQAALAEADAALAHKETHAATMPFQIQAAQAKAALALQQFEGKKKLAAMGAVGELQLALAKSELDIADSTLSELQAHLERLKPELIALKNKSLSLRQRLKLKTDEHRQAEEMAAQCQAAGAKLEQAQVALETAELRLKRMEVRSPSSGRVLALVARPGMRLMGLSNVSLHESSTVVMLYDPANLQIRADVRLEDVPRVTPGMKVKIHSAVSPRGPLDGEVLFATSQADIQKNTLQVKVSITNPPPSLRPDMLVQVTFLAPPTIKSPTANSGKPRLLIPGRLIEHGTGSPRVWVADQTTQTARPKKLHLGASLGDWAEVKEGLQIGDRIIATGREGLVEGQRIVITGEEPN